MSASSLTARLRANLRLPSATDISDMTKSTQPTPASQWAHDQALASARIEGFEPSAEFLADSEALKSGEITEDQMRERILARTRLADKTAGDVSNG